MMRLDTDPMTPALANGAGAGRGDALADPGPSDRPTAGPAAAGGERDRPGRCAPPVERAGPRRRLRARRATRGASLLVLAAMAGTFTMGWTTRGVGSARLPLMMATAPRPGDRLGARPLPRPAWTTGPDVGPRGRKRRPLRSGGTSTPPSPTRRSPWSSRDTCCPTTIERSRRMREVDEALARAYCPSREGRAVPRRPARPPLAGPRRARARRRRKVPLVPDRRPPARPPGCEAPSPRGRWPSCNGRPSCWAWSAIGATGSIASPSGSSRAVADRISAPSSSPVAIAPRAGRPWS